MRIALLIFLSFCTKLELHTIHPGIVGIGRHTWTTPDVAQTSKSAVPRASEPASCGMRIWKSAIQQIGKSALHARRLLPGRFRGEPDAFEHRFTHGECSGIDTMKDIAAPARITSLDAYRGKMLNRTAR
jgi:hypothetical protein